VAPALSCQVGCPAGSGQRCNSTRRRLKHGQSQHSTDKDKDKDKAERNGSVVHYNAEITSTPEQKDMPVCSVTKNKEG
jgi:hypothetical protein